MNERGFSICRTSNGKLVRGKSVSGAAHSVSIPNNCPAGSRRIGVSHTHPSGGIRLSDQDKAAARKHGMSVVCVETKERTKCYRLRRSNG